MYRERVSSWKSSNASGSKGTQWICASQPSSSQRCSFTIFPETTSGIDCRPSAAAFRCRVFATVFTRLHQASAIRGFHHVLLSPILESGPSQLSTGENRDLQDSLGHVRYQSAWAPLFSWPVLPASFNPGHKIHLNPSTESTRCSLTKYLTDDRYSSIWGILRDAADGLYDTKKTTQVRAHDDRVHEERRYLLRRHSRQIRRAFP